MGWVGEASECKSRPVVCHFENFLTEPPLPCPSLQSFKIQDGLLPADGFWVMSKYDQTLIISCTLSLINLCTWRTIADAEAEGVQSKPVNFQDQSLSPPHHEQQQSRLPPQQQQQPQQQSMSSMYAGRVSNW